MDFPYWLYLTQGKKEEAIASFEAALAANPQQPASYLALALLYQVTGKARYVEELDEVLDFLEEYLPGSWALSDVHHEACALPCGGNEVCVAQSCVADATHQGVLHHWMDGEVAVPQDPEFFCSGCNLQLLYVLWYRQHNITE